MNSETDWAKVESGRFKMLKLIIPSLLGLVAANQNNTQMMMNMTSPMMTSPGPTSGAAPGPTTTAAPQSSEKVYQVIKFSTTAPVAQLNEAAFKTPFMTKMSQERTDATCTDVLFALDTRRRLEEAAAAIRQLTANAVKVTMTWTLNQGTDKSTFAAAIGGNNGITTSDFEQTLSYAASSCNACSLSGVTMNVTVTSVGAGSTSNPATSANPTTTTSDAFGLGAASVFVILASRFL